MVTTWVPTAGPVFKTAKSSSIRSMATRSLTKTDGSGFVDTHTLASLQALGTTLDLEVERIWCGRALNKHPLRPHRLFIFIVVTRRHDFSIVFVVILAGIVIGIVSGVFIQQDADLY